MSEFVDLMTIKLSDDAYVACLSGGESFYLDLFNTTYVNEDLAVKGLEKFQNGDLILVRDRRIQMPVFETIRTVGTDERIVLDSQRVQLRRKQPRQGRLTWVDVFLDIALRVNVHDERSPIEAITITELFDEIGGAASLEELRNKLTARYDVDAVNAFFERFHISTLDEFKRRGPLFIKFIFEEAPKYDSENPGNIRNYRLNLCIMIEPALNISDSLQRAQLCRSILLYEHEYADIVEGGDVVSPYTFIVIFPDDSVTDGWIPGSNADQCKVIIQDLFRAENMFALFLSTNS